MNRRQFLGLTGGTALSALGIGGAYLYTRPNYTELPEQYQHLKPLMDAYALRLDKNVGRNRYTFGFLSSGALLVEYLPTVGSSNSIERIFDSLALLYADAVEEEDEFVPLRMLIGNVQGIVSPTPLKKYVNGELKKDAFLETIGISQANRS